MSKPEVFIVESLTFEDEEAGRLEGRIISQIHGLGGKECKYFYIRTKRELQEILKKFEESQYRYLHLSCHGSPEALNLTLDNLPFAVFAAIAVPYLRNRRLFLSACSATNDRLARCIMPNSGCYSILGPNQNIAFDDAAVLWASFYHVMFHDDQTAMKARAITLKAQELASLYQVPLTLVTHSKREQHYELKKIKPTDLI